MRLGRVLLVVAGLVVASACGSDGNEDSQPTGIPADGDPDLAELASDAVESFDIPAIALARVTLDDGIVVGIAGTRSQADSTPLTTSARFHLGSDTKAMTAVLIAQLVEAGTISLDDRITDVLPAAQVDPSRASITIDDVLTHRSGLEDNLDLAALHAADDPVQARRDAVYAALQSPSAQPTDFGYANLNYMVAGVVVEQITGKTWTDAMQDQIFEPLGITTCGFGAPIGDGDPLGHTPQDEPVPQDAPITDNPAALGPAGTVHCSLEDWDKFATALLQSLSGTDSPILSASTATQLFVGADDYAAGWIRVDRDGETVYTHDGSNTLWYARAILRPDRGDAVLLATNTGHQTGVAAIDELTLALLAK